MFITLAVKCQHPERNILRIYYTDLFDNFPLHFTLIISFFLFLSLGTSFCLCEHMHVYVNVYYLFFHFWCVSRRINLRFKYIYPFISSPILFVFFKVLSAGNINTKHFTRRYRCTMFLYSIYSVRYIQYITIYLFLSLCIYLYSVIYQKTAKNI